MLKKIGKRLTRIVGHPGTGKTTTLLSIVERLIQEHGLEYCTKHVLAVSFSRSAAKALIDGLEEKGVDPDQFRYFRTLHSLAARTLSLDSEDRFVKPKDAREFMKEQGILYNPQHSTIDDIRLYGYIGDLDTTTPGNAILSYFQYLKRILLDDDEVKRAIEFHQYLPIAMSRILDKFSGSELLSLYYFWEERKRLMGKYEYDDMLCEIHENGVPLLDEIEYGLIDEAQDLTPLQYAVLHQWLKDTRQVYLAGDEMQTLYAYQGASPEHLSRLEYDHQWVLRESYRVPQIPWEHAKHIAHENGYFTVDRVRPRPEEGDVLFITKDLVQEIIQDQSYGSFFILFRKNEEVFRFLDSCIAHGFLPHGLGRIATRASDRLFIRQYELIRKLYLGQPLSYLEVQALIIQLPARYLKHGVKTAFRNGRRDFWFPEREQLFQEPDTHAQFYSLFKDVRSVEELKGVISDSKVILDKGEGGWYKKKELLKITPTSTSLKRVNSWVGTYHSSKGLECDNTILFDYLPPRTTELKDELCLIFTGLTRTRNCDFIVPVRGYQGIIEDKIRWGGGIRWWS